MNIILILYKILLVLSLLRISLKYELNNDKLAVEEIIKTYENQYN